MNPPEHTRIVLSEFKEIGTPFKLAWASAMRTLPRKQPDYKEWKQALAWARPAFEACYTGGDYLIDQSDPDYSVLVYLDAPAPVRTVNPSLLVEETLVV